MKTDFTLGLSINDKLIECGDIIVIKNMDGHTVLSDLFRRNIVDEAIIKIFKHKEYNLFMFKGLLKKNNKILTIGERFESSKEDMEDNPRLKRKYFVKKDQITLKFIDDLKISKCVVK